MEQLKNSPQFGTKEEKSTSKSLNPRFQDNLSKILYQDIAHALLHNHKNAVISKSHSISRQFLAKIKARLD